MPRTRSLAWAELKLGVLGLVSLVLATVLVFAVGGQGGFFWQRYPLRARFDDVQGLKSGAIVRLNGMEVGKVTSVELAGAQVEDRQPEVAPQRSGCARSDWRPVAATRGSWSSSPRTRSRPTSTGSSSWSACGRVTRSSPRRIRRARSIWAGATWSTTRTG